MRKPKIKPRLAIPMALLAVGGGWTAGAVLGTPSLSAAATVSTTSTTTAASSTTPKGGPALCGPGGPAGANLMASAAKDIGISETALRSQLESGKTVAQVASAHKVSASTLISELTTTAKSSITSAYTAGKITQSQETQMLDNLTSRVTNFVNNTMPDHRGAGFRGGPGPGAGSNFQLGGQTTSTAGATTT